VNRDWEIRRYVDGSHDDTIETDNAEETPIARSSIWLSISTTMEESD
jgi:hypothetical protein